MASPCPSLAAAFPLAALSPATAPLAAAARAPPKSAAPWAVPAVIRVAAAAASLPRVARAARASRRRAQGRACGSSTEAQGRSLVLVRAVTLEALAFPAEVAGYACRPVEAEVPVLGRVVALVVDETVGAEELEKEVPDWVPKAWLSPIVGDHGVGDIYGAIGVWPAAFVCSEALITWARGREAAISQTASPWRCVEIGCGAGFPSLVAAKLGASVRAVDTEALPLALLQASFDSQQQSGVFPATAQLETLHGDASEVKLEDADVIVVSDLLYSVGVGRAVGLRLGRAAKEGRGIVLVDGGRSGREAFLQAFEDAYGAPGRFESVELPAWAPERTDLFDASRTVSVGVLRY